MTLAWSQDNESTQEAGETLPSSHDAPSEARSKENTVPCGECEGEGRNYRGTECETCHGDGTDVPPLPEDSDLCETPEEALKHVAAGRSWPALKASKHFDSERLNESPLFRVGGLLL